MVDVCFYIDVDVDAVNVRFTSEHNKIVVLDNHNEGYGTLRESKCIFMFNLLQNLLFWFFFLTKNCIILIIFLCLTHLTAQSIYSLISNFIVTIGHRSRTRNQNQSIQPERNCINKINRKKILVVIRVYYIKRSICQMIRKKRMNHFFLFVRFVVCLFGQTSAKQKL